MALRVLLTGHNGYIGSALGPFLQACGHVVVGIDTGFFRECGFGPDASSIPCLWKDIRDVDSDFLRRFDVIIHLAAIDETPRGAEGVKPDAIHAVNRKAASRLARLARKAGVSRFIFASSSQSAFGDRDLAEIQTRVEASILDLADESFSPVCLRLPDVYGVSRQFRADLTVNRMVCDAFTTGAVMLPESPDLHFHAIHVEDAAVAFANAVVAPQEPVHAGTFSLGPDRGTLSFRKVADALREAMPDIKIETPAEPPAPALLYTGRRLTAHSVMPGCRPLWSIETGICQIVDAFCQHGFAPEDRDSPRFNRSAQLETLLRTGQIQSDLHWKRNFGEELATWAA